MLICLIDTSVFHHTHTSYSITLPTLNNDNFISVCFIDYHPTPPPSLSVVGAWKIHQLFVSPHIYSHVPNDSRRQGMAFECHCFLFCVWWVYLRCWKEQTLMAYHRRNGVIFATEWKGHLRTNVQSYTRLLPAGENHSSKSVERSSKHR